MWGAGMAKRRIAVLLFVAILAAVISPVFDLLPTTLRTNHHHHAPAVAGRTLVSALHVQVHSAVTARIVPREAPAACILSMDCVRLC